MFITFTTTLVEKTRLAQDVYVFQFNLKNPTEIHFKAGQYLVMHVPRERDEVLRRQLSITTSQNQKNSFSLLFKLVPRGAASTYLMDLSVGGTVRFDGPAGKFILKKNQKHKVFLATGTGIAPIRSMLYQISPSAPIKSELRRDKQNYLFWGLQKVEDIYFFDELQKIAQEKQNFQFYICLSREKNLGAVKEESKKHFILGRVDKGIEEKLFHYGLRITDYEFYLCGGRTIVDSLKECLLEKGISLKDILFEKF